ncbi:YggT family protein [Bifidobacterium tsurumiense]|uniref:Putative integral membrane protein n=1 Tax=Bifidobacterium tsurumiense TaxID=356829 RepID=A0A087EJW2_9BIFI|nr:YggT family protein [Bifidobacterium tsurumiense]KFJ08063.1 putative integral membrane protein [Bifidobacterium tsurumiense]
MLLYLVASIIPWLIEAYITVLFIRMILDWVRILAPRWTPRGIVWSLIDIVYQLTEPPLRWLRRYIPPIRMGAIAFDTSFIVLYFILILARILI